VNHYNAGASTEEMPLWVCRFVLNPVCLQKQKEAQVTLRFFFVFAAVSRFVSYGRGYNAGQ
jgi:hypothetical protein